MRWSAIRLFAAEHSVSRFTVVDAYDRLVALGFLESRHGSGFYLLPGKTLDGASRVGEIERAFDTVGLSHQSLDESVDWLNGRGRLAARRVD